MAMKIRLTRGGCKKNPYYRIVAVDSRVARDGRYIEKVGTYNPLTNPPTVSFKTDVLEKWLDNGAKPSPTVARLLKRYRKEAQ